MPGIINNPLAAGTGAIPKFNEEAELPSSTLQPPLVAARVRGLSKIASQPIVGAHVRPNPAHAEILCQPRMLENLELAADRAVPDYGSSGSDHDPSSVSLFAMVHEFIENDGAGEQLGRISDGPGCLTINKQNFKVNGAVEVPQNIQNLAYCKDSIEETLLRDTQSILNSVVAEVRNVCDDGKVATTAHSCLKRMVMTRLQKMGYTAAICKTKWDHLCGTPAGDYEYIDVLVSSGAPSKIPERLLVDIDFQGQFKIARPTEEFTATLQLLPSVFVGRAERLKQIIHLISEATKQSLRDRGLHLPPWRKSGYMKAKWFSSYKRTSNITLGRPCREGGQHCNGLGLAVRGGGLDARYTNALEILYHDVGSKFLNEGGKDVDMCRREKDEITVTMTDWQPPAIAPRFTAPRKHGTIMGLTSLLSHAPASSSSEAFVQAA